MFSRNCPFKNVAANFAFCIALFLSGCAVQKMDQAKAELMPTEIALKIFEKHGYLDWTKSPEASCLLGSPIKLRIQDFDYAVYNTTTGNLRLIPTKYNPPYCYRAKSFKLDQKDASELVNAAISLGAAVKNMVVSAM